MAQKSKSDLKIMFKGGDSPTTEQYQDLIESNLNLTDGNCPTDMVFAGSLTLGNIAQGPALDSDSYAINGTRGEIRSQLQGGVAADTGWTLTLANTSIAADSLIIANVIGGDGAIISGSVLTANVISANSASFNFFNTGVAIPDDSVFTASFAIL